MIAVNVIGCDMPDSPSSTGSDGKNGPLSLAQLHQDEIDGPALASICDDLSYSMYVEESIVETVRNMEQMKMAAVNGEANEYTINIP